MTNCNGSNIRTEVRAHARIGALPHPSSLPLRDIFSPFGKGGSRGICLSGGEVFVAVPQRCFGTMEQCKRNKSPLTPLSQRGAKKKLQGFKWSRKIYRVLCTRRVQTKLMGNDQHFAGEGIGLPVNRKDNYCFSFNSQSKYFCMSSLLPRIDGYSTTSLGGTRQSSRPDSVR